MKLKMRPNLGPMDRAIRIGSGLAMVGMGLNRSSGFLGYLLSLAGVMLLAEGLTSYCVACDLMGIDSGKGH